MFKLTLAQTQADFANFCNVQFYLKEFQIPNCIMTIQDKLVLKISASVNY